MAEFAVRTSRSKNLTEIFLVANKTNLRDTARAANVDTLRIQPLQTHRVG